MHMLLRYLGTVAAVILTIYIVPGVTAGSWLSVFLAALVWSVITMVIRPILTLLTLPITIITFGLFALILNGLLFWLMAALVPGFSVSGFLAAFLGALVLTILNWLIHLVLPSE